MKKLPAILLCVLFAATAAEARTLYVNAKRPNNNGNGLKPTTAKKTIQAAVNIAKNGDTIIVYPGTYAPIKTNNKKIAVKSAKGAAKTKIVKTAKVERAVALARLGAPYDGVETQGKNTSLTGFLLDGLNRNLGSGGDLVGISGGTAKSCVIQRLGEKTMQAYVTAVVNASLSGCTVKDNYGRVAENALLNRCRITGNSALLPDGGGYYAVLKGGRLCNCLVVGNEAWGDIFKSVMIFNSTITKNLIFDTFSESSKFFNCILWNNVREGWDYETDQRTLVRTVHNVDSGNGYSRTYKDNRNPKFASGYKLQKGSPCIDQGKLTAAQKKLVGSVDLGGGKRIKGKAVDMGCYEY